MCSFSQPTLLLRRCLFGLATLVILPCLATAALVVERVGNGTHKLTSAAEPVFLVRFSTNGTKLSTNSLPMAYPRPVSKPFNLLEGGSSSSDGQLTRSVDGLYIQVPGYNATNQEPSITSSLSLQVLRTIGLLDGAGRTDTSRACSILTGSNFRSVVSVDGSAFWAAGQTGLFYVKDSTFVPLSSANLHVVNIFFGQLYCSKAGSSPGIYAAGSGLTTNGLADLVPALPLPGASPFAFQFNTAGNICYIADDRDGSGIMKFSYVSGSWVSNYTIGTGEVPGARGLTVDWSRPGAPVLYATTAETSGNRIIRVVDTGAGSVAETIFRAESETVLHGIDFLPMPAVWRLASGGNWSVGGTRQWSNWSVGVANGTHIAFQDVNAGTTPLFLTVTNNTALSRISSLTFSGKGYGSGIGTGYTLYGNGLNILGGIVSDSPLTQSVKAPLTLTADQIFTNSPGDLVLDGALGGNVALTKRGAGSLILNAANRFTGSVAVQEGTLAVNGVLTNSSLVVASGNLKGTGRITGSVTILGAGSLAPGGATVGTLTIDGPLFLNGTLNIRLAKSGTNCSSDLLAGIKQLTVGGTLNVGLTAGTLAAGDTFTFIRAASSSGTFAAVNLPSPGDGLYWDKTGVNSGVLVVRRVEPPQTRQPILELGSTFYFEFSGIPGTSYRVWASSDPTLPMDSGFWTEVASGNFDEGGMASLTDWWVVVDYPRRFYRVSVP